MKKIYWWLVGLIVLIVLFLVYWHLPLLTYTYVAANGQKIFSIKYPLRFYGSVNQTGTDQYGGYLDVGLAGASGKSTIHFIYKSGSSTFGNSRGEVAYSAVKDCSVLEKYNPQQDSEGFIEGYTTDEVDGKTICYFNDDTNVQPNFVLGEIILNPSPAGVVSFLYQKSDKFQAKLMIDTIKVHK